MSNEESVAGINVRQLRDEKQWLEECNELLREAYQRTLDQRRGRDDRIAQLEEALEELRSSFEARMERAAMWVDEGELNDYWRGNRDALQVCLATLAALSSSEASQKDRCECQSGSSALGQCKLEAGHTEDCAFEFAPEKEG